MPALAYFAAGGAKLAGVEQMHASFTMMGLPSWFGYFIGACEVAGAIGLLFLPSRRKLAAAGLAIIMLGAIYFHIVYGVPGFVPAAILLAMLIFVMAWNWRNREAAA